MFYYLRIVNSKNILLATNVAGFKILNKEICRSKPIAPIYLYFMVQIIIMFT